MLRGIRLMCQPLSEEAQMRLASPDRSVTSAFLAPARFDHMAWSTTHCAQGPSPAPARMPGPHPLARAQPLICPEGPIVRPGSSRHCWRSLCHRERTQKLGPEVRSLGRKWGVSWFPLGLLDGFPAGFSISKPTLLRLGRDRQRRK